MHHRRTDRLTARTDPNQYAPSTYSEVGGIIKSDTSIYERRRTYIINTREKGGIKAVLKLPDYGSYSMDLSSGVLSNYNLVKDLVEKNK